MSRNKIHIARALAPSWWICSIWLAFAVMVQVSIMHYLRVREVEANLVLITAVWYAIRVDSHRAAIYGLAAGLLSDIVSTATGGAWTISMTLVAFAVSVILRGFFADSVPLVATITFIATLLQQLCFWIVMGFEGYPEGLARLHLHEALLQAVLNAVVMTIVMLIARRFDERYA